MNRDFILLTDNKNLTHLVRITDIRDIAKTYSNEDSATVTFKDLNRDKIDICETPKNVLKRIHTANWGGE